MDGYFLSLNQPCTLTDCWWPTWFKMGLSFWTSSMRNYISWSYVLIQGWCICRSGPEASPLLGSCLGEKTTLNSLPWDNMEEFSFSWEFWRETWWLAGQWEMEAGLLKRNCPRCPYLWPACDFEDKKRLSWEVPQWGPSHSGIESCEQCGPELLFLGF